MRIVKIILTIGFLGFILFVGGTCYFQNCRDNPGPQLPSSARAEYTVTVKVTGSIYYSDIVTVQELSGGYKLVTMDGYWEVTAGRYKFKDVTLTLDTRFFGDIEIGRGDNK